MRGFDKASAVTERLFIPLALVALVALFLFPYVFLGRSLLPLDLIPIFQPWAKHARQLWGEIPPAFNPLLDAIQQYYPRRVLMTESLHAGTLPFWSPGVYGGSTFLGIQQGAVLYPPAWVLTLFRPEMQFGWSALLHLALAAVGGYLFFREVGLRSAGAAVGAIAFAFNGYVIVWLAYPNAAQWTLCWLPLTLFLWERGRRREDLRWTAGSAAALAMSLLGGHGQSSAYVLLGWSAWALSRTPGGPGRGGTFLAHVAAPAGLALLVALGQLLPALDYAPRTDRGARVAWEAAVRGGMPITQLWTFVLPHLFGDGTLRSAQTFWLPLAGKAHLEYVERSFYPGAAVLVFAAGAFVHVRRAQGPRRHLAIYGGLLTLGALLTAMGTPLYWPLWMLPGFGQFTAVARIICLAGWGLACLAALGADTLSDPDLILRRAALLPIGMAAAVGAAVALIGHFIYGGAAPAGVDAALERFGQPSLQSQADRELILALVWLFSPAALAFAVRGPLRPRLGGALAVAVVAADLFTFGMPFNPRSDPSFATVKTPEISFLLSQSGPFRFLSTGPPGRETDFRQRLPSNLPSTFGLDDISGSDSFVSKRYREWEAAVGDGASPWSKPGSVALRAAGVRYYLSGTAISAPGIAPASVTAPTSGSLLWDDPGSLPYARLHTNVQSPPTHAEMLRLIGMPNRAPVVALTDGQGGPTFNGRATMTPFNAMRKGANRVTLLGTAPEPGVLFICEQYDPGWRARVDGIPARVVPVDGMFVGIPVSAGLHRVEMAYQPDTYRVGAFGTLLGLAILLTLSFGAGRRLQMARPTER